MKQKGPQNKDEWAEFHEKNRELTKKMQQLGKTYHDLTDTEFKNTLLQLSREALEMLVKKLKSELQFYKKILAEPYYIEHPEKKETHRYTDALFKAKSINSKGKVIIELLNKQ